ncbi:5-hydroxytryptamine receptor 4-like [Exaiptasia diaphana]|uniref:G-protein coupled receptors family 1 profile domain-containing protein n=1 Tax=Exaiptasia diaphana TaxID=2652724 RepID=A0A913Y252_EXADI|nr:5-hydroxytryptamine receptor 4-like [Exaiptasia diaphana]
MSNETANNLLQMQRELQSRSSATFVTENVLFSLGESTTIIGNFLALVIVLRNHNLRRAIPNTLIVSLSVSGFLNGIAVVPISHTSLAASEWLFDDVVCQFQGFMVLLLGTCSLLTIALMSISRFYSVVKNNLYRRYFTFKRTLTMIFVVWSLGILAPVMFLVTGHRFVFIPAKVLCYVPVETDWFLILLAVFYVGLPSLVVLFCYFQIFLAVKRHKNTVFTSSKTGGPNVQEVKVTRMMFAIVVCFCFCWFPVLLIELVDIIRNCWSLPRPFYLMFTLLGGLSNIFNPLIYGFMNTTLRKELIKFLRLGKRRNAVKLFHRVEKQAPA